MAKLKATKKWLKEVSKDGFYELQKEANVAHDKLIKIQKILQNNLLNKELSVAKKEAQDRYRAKQQAYISFLRQKAKVQWVADRDENSKVFHRSIKQRRLTNTVHIINDAQGHMRDTLEEVASAFLEYYQRLLSGSTPRIPAQVQVIKQGPVLTEVHKELLLRPYENEEVRRAIFAIEGDKSPGPDRFGAHFFKDNWEIVGEDMTKAVLDFFKTGKLLGEVNDTFISLIPKISCRANVTEFRPISCCNTLYKCITKMVCYRLRVVFPDLISSNQGAFVHGRFIVHNIMVCQDLVRHYGRKHARPSCLIKLDLGKAYDTVEWEFIREFFEGLVFPESFI
ncbi:hypothetical protein RDABS01_016549 [Bienertia sinuspersici]